TAWKPSTLSSRAMASPIGARRVKRRGSGFTFRSPFQPRVRCWLLPALQVHNPTAPPPAVASSGLSFMASLHGSQHRNRREEDALSPKRLSSFDVFRSEAFDQ